MGWYARVDRTTGEIVEPKVREKNTQTKEFWDPIINDTDFKKFVQAHYQIGHKPMLDVEIDIEEE
jgi:23S rRNA A2030 N6-methylase RlmJ